MSGKLIEYVYKYTPVIPLIERSKKIVLPGFDGLPLYSVGQFFAKGIRKGSLTMRASSLAFNFFLALFPAIIFLFTLIPYLPVENFQEQLLLQLEILLPKEAYELSKTTIIDIISIPRGGLLSFGFIMALYFATNVIDAIISAFNQSYFTIEKRNFIKQKLVSFSLIFILSLMLIIAISLIIMTKPVVTFIFGEAMLETYFHQLLFSFSKWLVLGLLLYLSISFIYYLGPSRKTRFRFFSAGSSLATLLIIIVSLGFAYYINNFGQFNKLYGSIGTLIVIMLWINFNSIILLIGFELNVSIQSARENEGKLEK